MPASCSSAAMRLLAARGELRDHLPGRKPREVGCELDGSVRGFLLERRRFGARGSRARLGFGALIFEREELAKGIERAQDLLAVGIGGDAEWRDQLGEPRSRIGERGLVALGCRLALVDLHLELRDGPRGLGGGATRGVDALEAWRGHVEQLYQRARLARFGRRRCGRRRRRRRFDRRKRCRELVARCRDDP